MTRGEALALLHEFTRNPNLRAHAYGVEAAMRALARKYGADEELWGLTGLLHDFDWEIHPDLDRHPAAGAPILRERGVPEEAVEAILGHSNHTGVPRRTLLAKALYSVDELVGFITAVALVRPSRKVADVTVKSVKKKFKDKAFARGVNREDIFQGAAELEVDLDEHIALVLAAMKEAAPRLGL